MKQKSINISLPGFYSNFNINKLFINLFKKKNELFNEYINITAVHGSFPNNIWGLERYQEKNFSIKKLKKIINFYYENNIKICLEMDNEYIQKKDLKNSFLNKFLKENKEKITRIYLNSEILSDYIKSNYSSFEIETSSLNIKADLYKINKTQLNNNASKNIIISLNDFCETNCNLKHEHIKYLSLEQLKKKEITPYFPCKMKFITNFDYIKSHKHFISKEEMFILAKENGYQNFKLESNKLIKYLQQYCTIEDLIKFYRYYLIVNENKEKNIK